MMDRRTVLKGGIAIAFAGHTAVASAEMQEAPLHRLIRLHKDAVAVDRSAWDKVSDIDDTDVMHERPDTKVQTSRLNLGRSENGEPVFEPRYSRTEEHIREVFKRHDNWAPGQMFHGPQAWVAERRAAHYAKMEEKIAELRAIEAERKRIEDECGYTAALKEANRTMEIVRSLEDEIIAFVPSTLAEAVDKANWCVWAAEDDYCYLYDRGSLSGILSQALAAIGRAAV